MESSWFIFSVAATLLLGIAMALFKVPSFKGHSRQVTAFWMMLIPFLFSFFMFFKYLEFTSVGMVLTALVWGASFSLLVMLQMYALKHVNVGTLFPITSMSSLVVTILLGFLLFSNIISLIQFFGIIMVVTLVYLYTHKKDKLVYSNTVVLVGLGIIFLSVFNKILQKFVVTNFNIQAYQIYQYLFATMFSFLILLYVHRKDFKKYFSRGSLFSGSLIGIFSFFGAYSLLIALSKGSFVLVMSIQSLYIFVVAFFGAFLFKEKLELKKIILLVLSVAAVILIKIG